MTALETLFVMIATICAIGGCANIVYDEAVDEPTVSAAASVTQYSDSDGEVSGTIYFDYDQYDLSPSSISEIRQFASQVKSDSSSRVRVEGHCDERGTREYNLALGERRANTVKDYLMTYGISGDRLSVISYGKERPVNSGSNPLAWSQNRRSVTVKAN